MDTNNTNTNKNNNSSSIYLIVDFFSWLTKICSLFNLIITFPIYFSLLYFLYKRRHLNPFNSSFYRLFFALGIVDITKYSLYLLKKCSYWGWVSSIFPSSRYPKQTSTITLHFSMGFIICPISTQIFRHEYTKQFFRFILWPIFLISVGIVIPILQMPVCFRTNIVLNNNLLWNNQIFCRSFTFMLFNWLSIVFCTC